MPAARRPRRATGRPRAAAQSLTSAASTAVAALGAPGRVRAALGRLGAAVERGAVGVRPAPRGGASPPATARGPSASVPAAAWPSSFGEGGTEEPVGPLLGEWTRLGEHHRDRREAGLGLGEGVGDAAAGDMLELEQGAVAILDDQRRPGQGGQLSQGVGQPAGEQAAGEIGERFPLDRRDDDAVELDRIVAGREPAALRVVAC